MTKTYSLNSDFFEQTNNKIKDDIDVKTLYKKEKNYQKTINTTMFGENDGKINFAAYVKCCFKVFFPTTDTLKSSVNDSEVLWKIEQYFF